MAKLIDHLTRKGFFVELEPRNTYPSDKNFRLASFFDITAAIDRYCAANHHRVVYLSRDPLTFRLDGKEVYQAKLELGRSRFNSGYYIHCTQVID